MAGIWREQIGRSSSRDVAVDAYDRLNLARFHPVCEFSHTRIGFGHSTGFKGFLQLQVWHGNSENDGEGVVAVGLCW